MSVPELTVYQVHAGSAFPDSITVRIVTDSGGMLQAEPDGEPGTDIIPAAGDRSLMDNPGVALMGAETVLALFGYRLDRDRVYQDMSLVAGTFTREHAEEPGHGYREAGDC